MFKLVIKTTDIKDLIATSVILLTRSQVTRMFIFCLPEYIVYLNVVHMAVLEMDLWDRLFVLF